MQEDTPPTETKSDESLATSALNSDHSPEVLTKSKRKISKKTLLIAVGAVLLIGSSGALAAVIIHKNSKPTRQNTSAQDTSASSLKVTDGITADQTTKQVSNTAKKSVDVTTINGDTFFATPLKLADLNFFKDFTYFGQNCTDAASKNCTNSVNATDIEYYQVGTTKAGKKIIEIYASH